MPCKAHHQASQRKTGTTPADASTEVFHHGDFWFVFRDSGFIRQELQVGAHEKLPPSKQEAFNLESTARGSLLQSCSLYGFGF